jgi:hypothetical protein
MSSTVRPVQSRTDQFLRIIGYRRGPFLGLTLFVGLVTSTLFFIAGALISSIVWLNPLRFFREVVRGGVPLGFDLVALCVIFTATVAAYSIQRHWLNTHYRSLRFVATLILGFIIANVAIGSYLWIFTEFSELLVSGIADAIILFSILWTGRTIFALVAQGISRPLLMMAGLLRGLCGCIAGAALATTIARIQAGALDGFDDVHRFYIIVVPAIAGFGWCVPRPSRPSLLFTWTSLGFAALLVLWVLPFPFEEPAHVACHFPYEKPRHDAFGFELEPWYWYAYNWEEWAFAPGALTELTLRYVTQPLVGYTCTGRGELPPELLPPALIRVPKSPIPQM